MRLKLKIGILSLTLLLTSLILYSCVDEPFIAPPRDPLSEIRVLNLSQNVPNFSVTIDDGQPVSSLSGMAIPSATDYFDVLSGDRVFKIYDEAGNLIYQKELEITSDERMQIIFAGEYDSDPLFSSFGEIRFFEGYIYVDHSPHPGTSIITLINVAAPYDTVQDREYTRIKAMTPAGDTTYIQGGSFAFEDVYVIDSTAAGQYDFTFTSGSGSSVASETYSATFTSDKRGYIYLYGKPEAPEFFSYEIVTPPARPRY